MQVQNDCHSWNLRALLESTATPFTTAEHGPRAAIFRQGDPCGSVMHIERGRVWLAVTARSGKEAICGLLDTGAFLGEEGSLAAAAGPVGRTVTAQTDAQMHADILSWSRSQGLFAGVALEGATLREDLDDNATLYGKQLEAATS